MLEQFLNKKVKIKTGHEGEETEYGLTVAEIDGTLIKVEDSHGNSRVINTASANFYEIQLMD